MLKRHSLQISVAKNPKPDSNAPSEPNLYLDPTTMLPIVRELSIDAAKLSFAFYAGVKVLNTVCEIATIAAKAKL